MGKRYDEAVARVRERIEQGQVLTAYNALAHEDTTVGPYQTAVDWGVRYSVIGWGYRTPTCETTTSLEAARIFVDRVGTARAREAALRH